MSDHEKNPQFFSMELQAYNFHTSDVGCDVNKCENGGECYENEGEAFCDCPDGLNGELCEESKCHSR